GLRLGVSPGLLAPLDLAAATGARERRAALPGDELSLQARELALAVPDPTSAHPSGLGSAGRDLAAASSSVPAPAARRGAAPERRLRRPRGPNVTPGRIRAMNLAWSSGPLFS